MRLVEREGVADAFLKETKGGYSVFHGPEPLTASRIRKFRNI
jgi:hypothetical protein